MFQKTKSGKEQQLTSFSKKGGKRPLFSIKGILLTKYLSGGNGLKMHHGRFRLDARKVSSPKELMSSQETG